MNTESRRILIVPLLALAVTVALLLVFHVTVLDMVRVWNESETYTHGYVILPISLWLMWRERVAILHAGFRPGWLALPLIAASGFVWLLGDMAGASVGTHLGLVGMLAGCLWAVIGTPAARVAWFPLVFLVFMVPAGDFLLPVLMAHTADFTVAALRLTGIPVYREGLVFVIPSGQWSVVEACSGLRYLIASIMVGALFAYLSYRSWWRRALFLLASVLVPLVANWLRAYMIVMLGHLSGNKLAVGADHLIYGWVFFGVVMFALFWVGGWWREDAAEPTRESINWAGVTVVRNGVLQAAVAALAVAVLWLPLRSALEQSGEVSLALQAPAPAAGWTRDAAPAAGWIPNYDGMRGSLQVSYRKDGEPVTLYVAYYAHQTVGHELVQWSNQLMDETQRKAWQLPSLRGGTLPVAQGTRGVTEIGFQSAMNQQAWYWYWLDGTLTTSEPRAKLDLALKRLSLRDDDSAAVFIIARGGLAARTAAEAFVRDHGTAIDAMLQQARVRD
ncbi:exosortase A [Uliginosibacterium sp. H1]|uniref:exosortase A n=1 Tax=Uliginosibacterium sp. H1 TaxID=3114757 RepID=UPI002E16F86A|nr:exosortase A [Uliginosibacterium sp. H1]